MNLRQALARAIKTVRKSRNLTQEDFSIVSSRTYLSALERGLKSPTLDKVQEIADVMNIHPASLIVLAYAFAKNEDIQTLIDSIATETKALLAEVKVRPDGNSPVSS
ncbi:MAG: helix-turn-helix family protein [Firmicutes bacterium]|nr:helix-turn-helix family protein [Bacillota bacterium]